MISFTIKPIDKLRTLSPRILESDKVNFRTIMLLPQPRSISPSACVVSTRSEEITWWIPWGARGDHEQRGVGDVGGWVGALGRSSCGSKWNFPWDVLSGIPVAGSVRRRPPEGPQDDLVESNLYPPPPWGKCVCVGGRSA
jgi:hypothetical protein